jgi:hypothetical protein
MPGDVIPQSPSAAPSLQATLAQDFRTRAPLYPHGVANAHIRHLTAVLRLHLRLLQMIGIAKRDRWLRSILTPYS